MNKIVEGMKEAVKHAPIDRQIVDHMRGISKAVADDFDWYLITVELWKGRTKVRSLTDQGGHLGCGPKLPKTK